LGLSSNEEKSPKGDSSVTHMPIDLFFSYISIPGAIAVALLLWGGWKLTEPDKDKRPKNVVAPHRG
jgi:hypothetical protein